MNMNPYRMKQEKGLNDNSEIDPSSVGDPGYIS